jgi:hypothetical protein
LTIASSLRERRIGMLRTRVRAYLIATRISAHPAEASDRS